jgi:hypothetical protein
MSIARQQVLPEGLCTGPAGDAFAAVEAGNKEYIAEAIMTCYGCPKRTECYEQMPASSDVIMKRGTGVQETILAGIYVQKSRAAANTSHKQWLPQDPTNSPIDLLEIVRQRQVYMPYMLVTGRDIAIADGILARIGQSSPELVTAVGDAHAHSATVSLRYTLGNILTQAEMQKVFEQSDIGLHAARLLLGDIRSLPLDRGVAVHKAILMPKSNQLGMMRYAKVRSHRKYVEQKIGETIEPINVLDLQPEAALAAIRAAVAKKQVHLKTRAAAIHQPTIRTLAAECAAQHGDSPATVHAVDTYVRAVARHTRLFANRSPRTPLTPDEVRKGVHHFLNEVAAFRAHNIPRPVTRAAQTSLEDILLLEEKWAARGIASATFMSILGISLIDVEPYLQRHLDKFGRDPQELEQTGGKVFSHDTPVTFDDGKPLLQDYFLEDEGGDVADIVLDKLERENRLRKIEKYLQTIPPDHARAVALAFDLPTTEDIDIAGLCERLNIPASQLAAFAKDHIIPVLGSIPPHLR